MIMIALIMMMPVSMRDVWDGTVFICRFSVAFHLFLSLEERNREKKSASAVLCFMRCARSLTLYFIFILLFVM